MIRNFLLLFTLAVPCLLTACSEQEDSYAKIREEMYIKMSNAFDKKTDEELRELMEDGHLTAFYRYHRRKCYFKKGVERDACVAKIAEAANRGDPNAMDHMAKIMAGEDKTPEQNYEAYVWIWMKSHFVRDIYYFENDYVRGFQELDVRQDYILMRSVEERLGPEKVAQARAEAEEKMLVLAKKLEEYCMEWAMNDNVCYYSLGEQPSYEQYKEYAREKYGL